MSLSQIYTYHISYSQIDTKYHLFRYKTIHNVFFTQYIIFTLYILFSDIQTILSSQIYKHILFKLTQNIHFTEIYSTQKCTLYTLLRLKFYYLFTEIAGNHIISSSQKYTFPLLT